METLKSVVLPLQSCYKENKGVSKTGAKRHGCKAGTESPIEIYVEQKNIFTRYGKIKFIPLVLITTDVVTDHVGNLTIEIINTDDNGLVKKYTLKMENNSLSIKDLKGIYDAISEILDKNLNTTLIEMIEYLMNSVMNKYEVEVIG